MHEILQTDIMQWSRLQDMMHAYACKLKRTLKL